MSQWNVAAAQYGSRSGELTENIRHHIKFIQCAARERVDLLIFPEYSLTGLSATDYHKLALTYDAHELDPVQQAAIDNKITVVVGLPLRHNDEVTPGAIGFMPDGTRIACHKPQQEGYSWDDFSLNTPIIGQNGRSFALGINADGHEEIGPRSAADLGADLYATGRLVSEVTWQHEVMHLQRWAHKYNMPVLMANHAWLDNGRRSAGRSACWDERGQLVVRADEGELLVIGRRSEQGWQGEVIPLG